jgi:hypothetical protein
MSSPPATLQRVTSEQRRLSSEESRLDGNNKKRRSYLGACSKLRASRRNLLDGAKTEQRHRSRKDDGHRDALFPVDLGSLISPSKIDVTLDASGQHTVKWSVPLRLMQEASDEVEGPVDLPAGACNLYVFPRIEVDDDDGAIGVEPSAAGLQILYTIIKELARTTSALGAPDEVGAFPIHALVVCNTSASLELAMELFVLKPKLLTMVHVNHRNGLPMFTGESCLHIAAVNRREEPVREDGRARSPKARVERN